MAGTFILGKKYIAQDAVRLGRLVTDLREPQLSYYEPSPAINWKTIATDIPNYLVVDSSSRKRSWRQKLMSFVSMSVSKETSVATLVTTTSAKEHLLDNSKGYFAKMLENPEAKEWIEEAYNGNEEIYFVVSYLTYVDAEFTEFKVEFKLSDLSLGAFNTLIEGSDKNGIAIQGVGKVAGEQVYALMYQKVKVKVQDGKYCGATLKESQWVGTTNQLREAQTTETDEIWEAEVVESEFDEGDVKGWTKCVDEGRDFYL